MPVSTDAVTRGCIIGDKKCKLNDKCAECKREIIQLIELEDMFADIFAKLNYVKKRAVAK